MIMHPKGLIMYYTQGVVTVLKVSIQLRCLSAVHYHVLREYDFASKEVI